MKRWRRKFLGVMFECCRIYQRAYINSLGSAYAARCPRCFKEAAFRVGKQGTSARFFSVR